MNLDNAVLATCDNSVVFTTVPDEADLSISRVVLLELQCHDTRLEVVDPKLSLVTTYNEFSVVLVESHDCYFRWHGALDDSDRTTRHCVPNFDVALSSHKYLQSLFAKNSAADSFVVTVLGYEGPRVLEDCEEAGTADQSSVLRHGPDALDFVRVGHVERLNAAVVIDAP